MAKSFRLDPDLERQLQEVAARQGVSTSRVIRDALRRHLDNVGAQTLRDDLSGIIGAVEIGGDASRHTGKAFAELLTRQRADRQA